MKKGIKISCSYRGNMKSTAVCSECFYVIEWTDKFCWNCGCMLSPLPAQGDFEYISQHRKDYQEDTETGWEKDEYE